MHKTSAWPLAWVYLGLIVYASLYPFAYWRDQGVDPWFFLLAPPPRYWTAFDVVANVLGYMPLGFLLALSALRTGRGRLAFRLALLAGTGLSLLMETLQTYLPDRVPSNLDLILNVVGTLLGALSAWSLERLGVLQRWSRFRANWFVPHARGALVLLALWPVALLFPTAVPFGLGQVMERLEAALADVLAGSPFLEWLPVRDIELQPLLPVTEWLCVLLGLLIPGLLGYCIIGSRVKRLWFLVWMVVLGVGTTALSAALSFAPEHAWAWLDPPVQVALLAALALLGGLLWTPPRAAAALAVLALGVDLSLINQTTVGPYFEQTLFLWEQGRFIRFHGLAQWLGWLWPFAALVYVLSRLWGRGTET
ncbi:VanZ family protein [Rhodoferax sp.]|uniref:VanZ family protein n=1 Tax=Rhodoferax sp. TaxID=50421 RepID=UPI002624B58A|nr:VanZ family protein [Rhodoferax sp.]MDD2927187.1 VanZ family protein [Rhodoferax sp.]